MKAFFEEYGFVLVSICAVMMLVAMVPVVGSSVGDKLVDTVNDSTITIPTDDLKYEAPSK
ncbi:MAG: hypothetical protein Q4F12_02685 [Erysipelotrichaceae bacterium]|nr:hypothetical protein [Erysipelotrichaceae bacterium]